VPSRALIGAAVALLAAFALLGVGSGLFVDAVWFGHLGYGVIFRTTLLAKLACFAIGTLVATVGIGAAALYVTSHARERGVVRVVLRRGNGAETLPELIAPYADRIPWRALALAGALSIGVLFGLAQAANWRTYLLWLNGGSFSSLEPFFGRDVGFYVFSLPAYRAIVGAALGVVVVAGMASGGLFWLQGALDLRRPGEALPPAALRLLSVLLGFFFLAKAAGYWLARYELLLSPFGTVFGAGYTASHVRLPLLWLLVVAALVGAVLSVANSRAQGWRLPVTAVVVVFGASLLSSILPDLFQRLRVRPDELRLERPYLEHNIALTRRAYGLDQIRTQPFPAQTPLDTAAVERNQATFANIRLWDPGPLLDTYKQLQVIRLYYDFHDIDVDRYDLPGGRRQVMLAAREIVPALLPESARTWVNQRLQFTHGFGAVMSPVTEFQGEGLPLFFLKDIPPTSPVDLEIREPRIYFGERTEDYVVVGGAAEEFDYPKGEQNVTNRYRGVGGVRLGSLLRRLVFAWSFRDVNLLISGNLRADSRILFRRSLAERIARLAPFLRVDHDPYLVVSGGRLYWMLDAYTVSSTYPYSEPVRGLGVNYIRNSVKIVVDAYDGTVTFYAVDEKEPILAAYSRIFPGVFRPLTEMPEDLRRHVRYPEGLFLIQAEMYRTYHMTTPEVFYNKEDLWSFPTERVGSSRAAVEPYYIIMRLPGGEGEEFILMQPMTPSNRNNMVAWLAARCDAPHYGQLVEFQFSKERLIYGPQQIEARIDQDTLISQQLSLWNQMGSKVIRGNLLVIPVEDSIVYVEPLYLRSEQGQIPELKRVIVAYGDRVAMEPTLEAAIAKVFGGAVPAPPASVVPPPGVTGAPRPEAAAEPSAREHYRAALEGLRSGDWGAFAREMQALGDALENAPPEPTPALPPR
jgi:uncharacterized membrane protein (UPF0182 family)